MQGLGARALVVGGGAPPDLGRENYSESLDAFAEHVRDVAATAEPYGVALALEVNWCELSRSFRTVADLTKRIDRDNVGVVWDPAHFFSTPSRLSDLDDLHGRVVHAHLNDMATEFVEVVDINGDRVIPGEGGLPLREWTDKIAACGYDGWHCVELFNEALWKEDLETICRKVMDGCRSVWPEAAF
jgi:sugar phosphate isomerase/epimerase